MAERTLSDAVSGNRLLYPPMTDVATPTPIPTAEQPTATTSPPAPPPPPPPTLAPAVESEYNRTGVDFRAPMPWPKVKGPVIDFHCHLFAARHASPWFEAARH